MYTRVHTYDTPDIYVPHVHVVCYRCGVVKVFDNFTVGVSVKYFPICAVSFPFLSYFTYRLCVDILIFN